MQLLINASRLQAPVMETLERYVSKRLAQLKKFLPLQGENQVVRVSAKMERYEFVINIEINVGKPIFIQVRHSNLYQAIDRAHDVLKRSLRRK